MGPLPTVEPDLCTCFKPAHVTITKADAIPLGADAQQCQHGTHCKPGGIFLRGLQKQHVLKKKGADLQKMQDTGVERNETGKSTLKHEDRGATTGKRRRAMGPLPTVEPDLCTCFKPAHVTITKADAIPLGADAQQCQHGTHCKPGGIFLRGLQKQHVLKKKGADLQKMQDTGVERNETGKSTLKHEDRGATTGKRRRAMGPLPTVEPDLCTCFKPAHVTITKADAIPLGADAQQCQHGTHCKPGGIFLRGLQKQHVLKKKGADLQKMQDTGVERNETGKSTLKHE
ncbi:uncharacterized protein LOC135272749, partial [Aotus nancymaae]